MSGLEKKSNGFTLVEITIYIAILAIFLISMIQFAMSVTTTAEKASSMQEVEQNIRFAMERMKKEIRAAGDINISSSVFDSNPGVISINHDDPTKDPTVFSVNSGILQISQGSLGAVDLTTDDVVVSNLIFRDFSRAGKTKNYKIEMTVEWASASSIEYETSVTRQVSVVVRSHE